MRNPRRPQLLLLAILALSLVTVPVTSAFQVPFLSSVVANGAKKPTTAAPADDVPAIPVKNVVTKVAVAGATGRTGQFVVQELLNRGVSEVVAVVRDSKKANEVFSNAPSNLEIVKCDLGNVADIAKALDGCDAAIWCATGFSDNPDVDVFEQIKRFFGIALAPKRSIDVVGLPAIADCLKQSQNNNDDGYPKVVMCSSAGVTRPGWDAAKKAKYPGAADIPIVRLNPFNILERKLESEEELRKSGVNYCVVRPCGLNDKWPAGSRPVFSQGDVAAGRNNRKDVAKVLVDVLSTPEATGKTFEMISMAGYPAAVSLSPALARLKPDGVEITDEMVESNYALLQQLLPGEQQDSAALAMGQTYEQLDEGKTGRLGERGKENLAAVGLKPSS